MRVVLSDGIVDIDKILANHIEVFRNILSDIPDADMIPLQSVTKHIMDNILYYVKYDMEKPVTVEDTKYIDIDSTWIHVYFEHLSFNEIVDILITANMLGYKNLYDMAVVWISTYLDKFCSNTQIFGYINKHKHKHHIDFVMPEGIEYDEEERFYDANKLYDF